MTSVYEEGEYKIDCTSAIWSTNEINTAYHSTGVNLKDVDWIIEDEEYIYMIVYKNSLVSRNQNPDSFNPNEDKKINDVVHKFYDSLHYLYLNGKCKKRKYIYIVEAKGLSEIIRKKIKKRLYSMLPFKLQEHFSSNVRLIENVEVLSIAQWNSHEIYGKYPISKV